MNKNLPIIGCMRWGVWGAKFSTKQYEQIIQECIQIGLTRFDHADIYGHYTTEVDFGKALQSNGSLRNQIQLITKCGIKMITPNRPTHAIKSYDSSATHIIKSVEQSLQNFHTDYIDTLLIHRPDILLHPEEVAATITTLQQQGKIKTFGVSNFSTDELSLLKKYITIDHHQIEISINHMNAFSDGTLQQSILHDIEIQAWSPWGNGLFEIQNEKHERIILKANELAEKYHVSINEILLAFLYIHPANITPVIGTTQFARIKEAKRSMEINLSREDFYQLWQASTGHEVA